MRFPALISSRKSLIVAALISGLVIFGTLNRTRAQQSVAWDEQVSDPVNARQVKVHRTVTYRRGNPFSTVEDAALTIYDNSNRVIAKWRAEDTPDVTPIALYFQEGAAVLVTSDVGFADRRYGCSFTNRHRLFKYENGKWNYDRYSKVNSRYVGGPNMRRVAGNYGLMTQELAANANSGQPPTDPRDSNYIDMAREKPMCDEHGTQTPSYPELISLASGLKNTFDPHRLISPLPPDTDPKKIVNGRWKNDIENAFAMGCLEDWRTFYWAKRLPPTQLMIFCMLDEKLLVAPSLGGSVRENDNLPERRYRSLGCLPGITVVDPHTSWACHSDFLYFPGQTESSFAPLIDAIHQSQRFVVPAANLDGAMLFGQACAWPSKLSLEELAKQSGPLFCGQWNPPTFTPQTIQFRPENTSDVLVRINGAPPDVELVPVYKAISSYVKTFRATEVDDTVSSNVSAQVDR